MFRSTCAQALAASARVSTGRTTGTVAATTHWWRPLELHVPCSYAVGALGDVAIGGRGGSAGERQRGGSGSLYEHTWARNASCSAPATGATADMQQINISDATVRQLRLVGVSAPSVAPQDEPATLLRVSVDAGGCSGFQYAFTFADSSEVKRDDKVFEKDGVAVVVDGLSLGFLQGATIDYSEELIRASFQVVDNPNAESGCGCGASFVAK